CASGRPAMDYW
nr:immunoglobulin heavy chain junction region [Mus musculus]